MPRVAAVSSKPMVAVAAVPISKRRKAKKARPSSVAVVPIGRLRGHGDYTYDNPGPWGKAGRWIGSALGSHFAGPGGGKLGGKLGSYLHYIGKIFGSGDYITSQDAVKYNVLVNESQVPQFSAGKNVVHIRHREYLGDVLTSGTAGAFRLSEYPIQPGLAASFPWLSQVCGASFQQYRINGMVFEFRSMSADALNSTNTALGSVVMATDYDSKDASFQTKAQMENTEFGVSCKPSSCMIHAIECARGQTSVSELYLRNGAPPSGTDLRLYDLGRFSIATVGFQGTNVNIGELWVTYDITLLKAIQLPPAASLLSYHLQLAATSAATPLLPLTTYESQPIFDNIGLVVNALYTTLTFPLTTPINSQWILMFMVRGASTAALGAPTITGSQGLVTNLIFQVDASAGYNAPQTQTGTTIMNVLSFRYDGTGTAAAPPLLTFSGGTYPGAPVAGDLLISQLNGTFTHG